MADYKDILSGTLGKLADKVKETASSTGVLTCTPRARTVPRPLGSSRS